VHYLYASGEIFFPSGIGINVMEEANLCKRVFTGLKEASLEVSYLDLLQLSSSMDLNDIQL